MEQNGVPTWAKWPCARQAASTSRRSTGSCKGSPIVSVGSSRGAMAIATARERSGRFLPPRERRRVSTPDLLMSDKTEPGIGEMHYDKSILELIGETPLVRLNRIASG